MTRLLQIQEQVCLNQMPITNIIYSKDNISMIIDNCAESLNHQNTIDRFYHIEKKYITKLKWMHNQLPKDHPSIRDLCYKLSNLISCGTDWLENLVKGHQKGLRMSNVLLLEQFNLYLNDIIVDLAWIECRELNYIQTLICIQGELSNEISSSIRYINISNILRQCIRHRRIYEYYLEILQTANDLARFKSMFSKIKTKISDSIKSCIRFSAEWGMSHEVLYSYISDDVLNTLFCMWDINIVDTKKKRIITIAKLIQLGFGIVIVEKTKQRSRFSSFVRSHFQYTNNQDSTLNYIILAHDSIINTRLTRVSSLESLNNLYELSFLLLKKVFVINSTKPITFANESNDIFTYDIELSKEIMKQISGAITSNLALNSSFNEGQQLRNQIILDKEDFIFGSHYILHNGFIPDISNTLVISCVALFTRQSLFDNIQTIISIKGMGSIRLSTKKEKINHFEWKSYMKNETLKGSIMNIESSDMLRIKHPCIGITLDQGHGSDSIIKILIAFGSWENCKVASRFIAKNDESNSSNHLDEKENASVIFSKSILSDSVENLLNIFSYYNK